MNRKRLLLNPLTYVTHTTLILLLSLAALAQSGCAVEVDEEQEELGVHRQLVSAPLGNAYCQILVSGKGWKDTETDYLPHVIQCENGGANLQALKAQAIAARSVAYYNMATTGSICDGQGCQVYSCGATPNAVQRQAVRETAGMYLSYGGMLTYGFYVAGSTNAAPPSCHGSGGATEHYVTYNEGRTGGGVRQTSLGYVGPPGFGQNRGCMSQWGARCLENSNGYDYRQILKFYYGADINITTAPGACTGCKPKCDGSKIIGSDCGVGDCAAFGATCVDDSKGVRCVNVFCPAVGDKKVCVDDSQIMDCSDGHPSNLGDCGAYGAYCSMAAGKEARCVSVFCVSGPSQTPEAHSTCLPDGEIAQCDAKGALSDLRKCPSGQTCVGASTGARCGLACKKTPVEEAKNEVFEDMPADRWGYEEALALYDGGMVSGCQEEPRLFCPSCETSRAAMVKWLVLGAELPLDNPPEPTFSDVPIDHWAYEFVETAAKHGITNGCGNGNFCPTKPVTRKMAAVFITRTMGWDPPEPLETSFDDVPEDHKNLAEIETLLAHCVVRGCNKGKSYCPDELLNRVTAAVMVSRAFELGGINPCEGADEDPQPSSWIPTRTDEPDQTGGAADASSEGCHVASVGGSSSMGRSLLLVAALFIAAATRQRRKGAETNPLRASGLWD